MVNFLSIIQSRLGSTRLKYKALLPINNLPLIVFLYKRVITSKLIDKTVIAIPNIKDEDFFAEVLERYNIPFFRGNHKNVLERFYKISKKLKPKNIVRITGDCPFIDPEIIDDVIKLHSDKNAIYTSNARPPNFPDGLDVEVFKYEALVEANKHAKTDYEKEHVVPYIVKNNNIENYKQKLDFSHYRWTVDTIEDYIFVKEVFDGLRKKKLKINYRNLLEFVSKNKKLMKINHFLKRGYNNSN